MAFTPKPPPQHAARAATVPQGGGVFTPKPPPGAAPSAATSQPHRGILGEAEHAVAQTGSDLYHAAVNTPAGVYYLGKGLATHPVKTVEAVGKSTAQDFEHPLRHPGYTLLDLLGVAGGAAGVAGRIGAAAKALEAGGTAADAAKALAVRPTFGERTLTSGDLQVHPETSRSALGAGVQKLGDKALQRAASSGQVRYRVAAESEGWTPPRTGHQWVRAYVGRQEIGRMRLAPVSGNWRIEDVEVDPEFRQRGVAKALFRHAETSLGRVVHGTTISPEAEAFARATPTRANGAALRPQAALRVKQPGVTGRVAADLLNRKIGKVVTQQARTRSDIAKGPSASLISAGRKLSPGEQKALQVVAEEAPLHGRITAASARVTGAKDAAARARHQSELDLLHQAKPHLDDTGAKPVFAGEKAAKLGGFLDRMRDVSTSREELLKNLGLLTDESIQGRKSAGGRIALGQPLEHPAGPEPPTPGQLSLIPEAAKPALHEASPAAVRIPDVATRAAKSLGKAPAMGAQGTIGHPRAPGSVTHEFTGALREQALRRQDTTRLVGESGLEAAKLAGLKHVVDLAKQAAQPSPTRPDDVAIRLDNIGASERTPLAVKQMLTDPESFYAHAHPDEKQSAFEKLRSHLIIAKPHELSGEAATEFQRLHAEGKIGWVPRRILGDLAKPQAPISAVVGKTPVRTVDAINNASRFAILYLKPAYALPNVLGNGALNLLQQGFAAVPNLARAVALNHRIGPELTARVDTVMGEGFAQALSSHGAGVLHTAVDKAASVWSKGVDTPFRRSSFIYEARREGFKTPADFERLLTDKRYEPKLIEVTQRANREIIDYANLSPAEREVVRRVIMFYPWVKGSTTYAGRLLREHPVKAAALGQIGKEGHDRAFADLGLAPSYLEGSFKVGNDTLMNPAAAAILQTPAQIGGAIGGVASGNISQATSLAGMTTPALNLALAEILRKNLSSGKGYPGGTNALRVARDALGNSLPQATLYRNIHEATTGGGRGRLYPPSVRSALEQYIIGSIAPRKYNPAELRRLGANERTQMKTGR